MRVTVKIGNKEICGKLKCLHSRIVMMPGKRSVNFYDLIIENGENPIMIHDLRCVTESAVEFLTDEAPVKTEGLTFGEAIEAMKKGKKCSRRKWGARGIYIVIQQPDAHSKMTEPYLFIEAIGQQTLCPGSGTRREPWAPCHADMLAKDWVIVDAD